MTAKLQLLPQVIIYDHKRVQFCIFNEKLFFVPIICHCFKNFTYPHISYPQNTKVHLSKRKIKLKVVHELLHLMTLAFHNKQYNMIEKVQYSRIFQDFLDSRNSLQKIPNSLLFLIFISTLFINFLSSD